MENDARFDVAAKRARRCLIEARAIVEELRADVAACDYERSLLSVAKLISDQYLAVRSSDPRG
jgi:hypothetical protein